MSWCQHAPQGQRKSLDLAFYNNTVREGGLASCQLVKASSSLPQADTVCHGSLMSSTGSYRCFGSLCQSKDIFSTVATGSHSCRSLVAYVQKPS